MLVKSKVKYIQSLGQKKLRDEAGFFVVEGPKIVNELLQEIPQQFEGIYALNEWIEEHPQASRMCPVHEITEIELERISQLKTPNEVVAVLRQFDPVIPIETRDTITLALDGIQDPGNLGTIIRIADWYGISQIVCSQNTVDMYNGKVVQATMASIARVKVSYTSLAEWISSKPVKKYAATLGGEQLSSMEEIHEGIIIIGNESKGISEEIVRLADVEITIERKGNAESLNAAVAAGIILSKLIG